MLQTQYNSNFRISRFGSAGVVLRARENMPLAPEEIRQFVPSVFAEEKHASRSERYTYIPTTTLLDSMQKEGFYPVEIRQGGTKEEEKRAFTKHLIRFRPSNTLPKVGDSFPEIVLVNSHDGTSSYQLMAGWFRLVCSNGMVVSEASGPSIKVSHRGHVDDVIEASYRVVEDFPQQAERISHMQALQLEGPEQVAFATAAARLRFEDHQEVSPVSILRPNRRDDAGNSLWLTFNRVQENIMQGGVRTVNTNERGERSRRRSREVNGISENVRLNQALWTLAEEMRKIKAA